MFSGLNGPSSVYGTVNTFKPTGCSNYCAHTYLCIHTLTNLQEFYILGMIEGLVGCFIQLRTSLMGQ